MKKLILLILLLGAMAFGSQADKKPVSDYCDGWEQGYCQGWKSVKGQMSLCPITPVCPVAKVDCNSGYRCGYNRGFVAGRKKAGKDG